MSERTLVTGASASWPERWSRRWRRRTSGTGRDAPAGRRDLSAGSGGRGGARLSRGVDWAPLLANVDAVVHLAGIAHIGLDLDPAIYDRVIHAATTELAAACAKANVRRLVFMSSVRAQSGASAQGVLRETDHPLPAESYGRAKLAAEAAVLAGPTPSTVLRPVMVYGPGVAGNLARLLRIADTPLPLPFAASGQARS